MTRAGRSRTRARKRAQPDRLDDPFVAEQRWVLIGIGVLLAVALISFALDWFRDPVVHRILLIVLAVGGVGVIVVIPLGLGASGVFWRTTAQVCRGRPSVR